MSEERMRVLEMIREGKITADEGARLLEALKPKDTASREAGRPSSGGEPPRPEDWIGNVASSIAGAFTSGNWRGFRDSWTEKWCSGGGGAWHSSGAERRQRREAEGWQFLSFSEGDHGTFDLPEGASLTVESEAGAIEAAAADGPARLDLEGTELANFAVYVARKDQEVVVSAYKTAPFARMPRLRVAVPARVPHVRLRTAGGSLLTRGLACPVNLDTAGGSIDVREHGQGEVDARTAGGSVRVQGDPARAALHTAGGSIHFAGQTGALEAKTAGGSIHVEGARLTGGQHRAETVGGSVTVLLAPSSSVEINARTTAGRINVDLPGTEGEVQRTSMVSRSYRGRYNGGAARLEVSTAGGSIRIGLAAEDSSRPIPVERPAPASPVAPQPPETPRPPETPQPAAVPETPETPQPPAREPEGAPAGV